MSKKTEEGVSLPVVGPLEALTAHIGYDPSRIKARIQFITPELAAEWLKLAEPNNRNKRPRRVETIARDMFADLYALTGVPIIIDEEGMIPDGRHRLAGCVRANKGFWCVVIAGINRAQATPHYDGNAVRTMGDRLKMIHGCDNANAAASISFLIWQFTRPNKSSSWAQPSFPEIEKIFLKYRTDIEWVMNAIGAKIEPAISSGGAPVLAPFVFTRSINRSLIDGAALAFKVGDNLKENDPIRKLRQKVSAEGGVRTVGLGNKNSSSQFSRFALSMYTLECLERVLLHQAPRSNPKGDPAVLDRVIEMLKESPTAIRMGRTRTLPPEPALTATEERPRRKTGT